MKILQKNKLKNNATENSKNLTSHFQLHTSHGITLMSLVIYITIMFVVLAIIMRVTTYFTKNISDVADVTFETEFEKLNMYMLQETKKTGNIVLYITDNSVTFSDRNHFDFIYDEEKEIGAIYYNGAKLCENIQRCTFSFLPDENTLEIELNDITKPIKYAIASNELKDIISEETYIINKEIQEEQNEE